MFISLTTHAQFKVLDASGKRVPDVTWVDTDCLEYSTWTLGSPPQRHRATSIEVDWAAWQIHLDRPRIAAAAPASPPLKPCDQCRQPHDCERVHYCPAYRCGFGEVKKP